MPHRRATSRPPDTQHRLQDRNRECCAASNETLSQTYRNTPCRWATQMKRHRPTATKRTLTRNTTWNPTTTRNWKPSIWLQNECESETIMANNGTQSWMHRNWCAMPNLKYNAEYNETDGFHNTKRPEEATCPRPRQRAISQYSASVRPIPIVHAAYHV